MDNWTGFGRGTISTGNHRSQVARYTRPRASSLGFFACTPINRTASRLAGRRVNLATRLTTVFLVEAAHGPRNVFTPRLSVTVLTAFCAGVELGTCLTAVVPRDVVVAGRRVNRRTRRRVVLTCRHVVRCAGDTAGSSQEVVVAEVARRTPPVAISILATGNWFAVLLAGATTCTAGLVAVRRLYIRTPPGDVPGTVCLCS